VPQIVSCANDEQMYYIYRFRLCRSYMMFNYKLLTFKLTTNSSLCFQFEASQPAYYEHLLTYYTYCLSHKDHHNCAHAWPKS